MTTVKQKTIRVLGVDDHELVMQGLAARLEDERDIELIARLTDAKQIMAEVPRSDVNVVLMDIAMPGPDPFEAIADLKRVHPEVKAIILSGHVRDHYVDAAIDAGAWGYLSKNDAIDEIVDAIRRVARGEFVLGPDVQQRCQVSGRKVESDQGPVSKLDSLTPREMQVLRMIGRGLGRTEIAQELHRSPRTIDNHRASIMRKLDITDRVELVRYAIREGLVEA